jgi:peptide chain release factor 1
MVDKLEEVERRFDELSVLLSSPEIVGDRQAFQKFSREHSELSEVVEVFRLFKKQRAELADNLELLGNSDSEIVAMAKEEVARLKAETAGTQEKLELLLIPKDPNDAKNVIMEIRAGAGGDEASIFAGELFRMYNRYVEGLKWKVEVMECSHGAHGGFKEVICMIKGNGAFSRLKFESGVHRVQRVPATEAQGRVHTSTVTVAVLPEAEEVDVQLNMNELRIDVYRSSGPGGQSVNTTDSAVRITHVPTGLVVAMQDEKSQQKNKEKALRVLRSRLLDKVRSEADAARSAERRSQLGTGDRSEKIRTYNFPQSRCTDHRIGLTVHNLAAIMEGKLEEMIDPILAHAQAEALGKGTTIKPTLDD